ncbi:MAG: hypothetical protein HDT48_04265 [Ruminococcaceae bacterium]|nr:hypothetical protein [Oscillospiraceae bacterium]
MKFYLMEILIVLFLAAAFIFLFKKRFGKKVLIGFTAMILLFGIFAGNMVNLIPIPTEPVILTALDDKNEASTSTQVAICRIIVDEKEYPQKNPSQGKWFWRGDELWWRPENDSRQPDGLTQTIVLDIPIGNSRIIEFASYWNRGMLKVESGDKSKIIDTYITAEKNNVFAVLAATSSYKVILFKLFKLFVFALIIAALAFYPIFALLKFGNERVKNWFVRNWDKAYYLIIAILYVVVLQSVSTEGSFWCDEVWQLGWIYAGYPKDGGILGPIVNKAWFNIMPYGQEYLRLLPQLFVAGSIFINGLTGSEYKNKRFGILLSSSVAFSLTIMNQCGMCIRDYALLLLSSSFMLFMYVKKQKYIGNEKIHLLILYGLSAAATMNVHQFGLVTAGLFMISDLILILLKKSSKKAFIEFLIPAIYGVYWLIGTLLPNIGTFNNYGWAEKATVARLFDAVQWLFCYNNILLALFIFGTVAVIFKNIFKIHLQKFNYAKDYTILTITIVPIILIFITYFYSTVINPENSLFIDRYFISIIICLYFVMCYGADEIITYIGTAVRKKSAEQVLVISCVCLMCIYNWSQVSAYDKWAKSYRTANTDFKSTIEYVMKQKDAYAASTLYIMDIHSVYGGIGIEYYITHKNERDDINHCAIVDIPENFEEYSTVYISYVYRGDRYNSELNEIIDSEFKLDSDNKTAKVKKYVRK